MSGLPAYTFEVQFGTFFGIPNWFDVTSYLELAYGSLSIARGRQDETSTPQTGRGAAVLNNADGRFTPGLASSPYYPNVLDGAPVRITCRIPLGKNLEDNPSHETGIAEWSGAGPGTAPTLAPSTTRAHGLGLWSLLVTWANQASASAAQRRIYGLTAGQQYTWSRWVYVPTGSPDVRLAVGDGVSATGSTVSTKDAWAQATVTFTAALPSHNLQLQVTSSVGGGQCWTDDGQGETGGSATSVDPGAVLLPRFYGPSLEWSFGWQGQQAVYALTQLVAQDVTGRLGDHAGRLRAFDVEEALLDSPLTCLPLDEPSTATQAGNLGSASGVAVPVNVGGGGSYAFAAATGPPADGTSSLTLTRASATSGYYLRAPTSLFASAVTVEAWINTATASTTVADLAQSAVGNPYAGAGMTLSIDAAGKLQWKADSATLTVTSPSSVANGATHHVAAVYQHTGSQHTATLYVDGASVATGSVGSTWVLVSASYLLVGGGMKLPLFNGTINHVSVYGSALSADRILAHYQAGWTGFSGERSDARISRLAAYAGLSSLTPGNVAGLWVLDDSAKSLLDSTTVLAGSQLALEVGSATVYGQSGGGDTPLAAMQAVANTEGGLVLGDRSGFLQFQSRGHRYNVAAKVSLLAEYVDPGLPPTYNDLLVANDVTVTTQDGVDQRFVDTASTAQRGTYDPGTVSSLTRSTDDAYQAAAWRVNRQGSPKTRYPTLTVDLLTLPADVVAAVLALDVGDRVDVTGLPTQAPGSTASLFVEGYTETVTADSCSVAFNCSSAAGWQVWVLNSPNYTLDSTTVLAW